MTAPSDLEPVAVGEVAEHLVVGDEQPPVVGDGGQLLVDGHLGVAGELVDVRLGRRTTTARRRSPGRPRPAIVGHGGRTAGGRCGRAGVPVRVLVAPSARGRGSRSLGERRGRARRRRRPASMVSRRPASKPRPLTTTRSASSHRPPAAADGAKSWGSAPAGMTTSTSASSPTSCGARSPRMLWVATTSGSVRSRVPASPQPAASPASSERRRRVAVRGRLMRTVLIHDGAP